MSNTDLIIPEVEKPLEVFTDQERIDVIIKHVAEQISDHEVDLSTDKGRKAIASLSRKASTSKVFLSGKADELIEGIRREMETYTQQIEGIRTGQKYFQEEMDKLRDLARKPLTDWEAEKKAFEEGVQSRIQGFADIALLKDLSVADITAHLEALAKIEPSEEAFGRHVLQAETTLANVIQTLREDRARAEEREAKEAEFEALKKEAAKREVADAERAAKEAEERAAQEAKIRAEEAEAQVKAHAEAMEQAERDQEERHKREMEAAKEKSAKEAVVREAQARIDAFAAQKAAEQRAEEAEAQAKQNLLEKQQQEAALKEKELADEANRKNLIEAIGSAMKELKAPNYNKLAEAILDGKIPHLRVEL